MRALRLCSAHIICLAMATTGCKPDTQTTAAPVKPPSLNALVSDICNAAAKEKFTPGGELMPEEWTIEKKADVIWAHADLNGMSFAGVVLSSPARCVVHVATDGSPTVQSVDLQEGGNFDFSRVEDKPGELEFHDQATDKK